MDKSKLRLIRNFTFYRYRGGWKPKGTNRILKLETVAPLIAGGLVFVATREGQEYLELTADGKIAINV